MSTIFKDGITYKYDHITGALALESSGGRLLSYWPKKTGISRREITSLKVSKGKIVLPPNASRTFYGLRNLQHIDLRGFDSSEVTNMAEMFAHCESLESIDLGPLNTSKVITMHAIFANCRELKDIGLSSIDTANIKHMSYMFCSCHSLQSVDLRNFNTSKVTKMDNMFAFCENLNALDLSGFDTSCVKNMKGMFLDCKSLTKLDISNFSTSKVKEMQRMFQGCEQLAQLSTDIYFPPHSARKEDMFTGCKKLNAPPREIAIEHAVWQAIRYLENALGYDEDELNEEKDILCDRLTGNQFACKRWTKKDIRKALINDGRVEPTDENIDKVICAGGDWDVLTDRTDNEWQAIYDAIDKVAKNND